LPEETGLGRKPAKTLKRISIVEEVLIFANPIAGRGRGKSIARRLEVRLRADGYACACC